MSGDIENPRIWVNAAVRVAPPETEGPDDLTTPWPIEFESLGLTSEDGITEGREQEVTDHYAHGGILVRTTKSKHKRTFEVMALEDNAVVFGLANPGSEAETDAGVTTRTVKIPNQPDPRTFGMELVDGEVTCRRVIPRGEVTEVGETVLVDNAIAMVPLTITVYPDADGVLYYEITDAPGAEVPGS